MKTLEAPCSNLAVASKRRTQGGSKSVMLGNSIPTAVEEIACNDFAFVSQGSSESAQNEDLSLDLMTLPDLLDLDWLIGADDLSKENTDGLLDEFLGNVDSMPAEVEVLRSFDSNVTTNNSVKQQTVVSSSSSSYVGQDFLTDFGLESLNEDTLSQKSDEKCEKFDAVIDFIENESSYIECRDIVRSPMNCLSPVTSTTSCQSPSGNSSGYESDNYNNLDDPLMFNEDFNLFNMAGDTLSELFPTLY